MRKMIMGASVIVALGAGAVWAQSVITPPTAAPPALTPPGAETPAQKLPEPGPQAIAAQIMIDGALKKIDKDIKREGNVWQFAIGKRQVIIITDPLAERMRIMVPVTDAKSLSEAMLTRLMQANFDSALDARYAVAQDVLWGTYIHSLTSLTERDFVSGLSQAVSIAENFGGSFSSGAIIFGGGDSQAIQADQLLDLLKEKSEAQKRSVI